MATYALSSRWKSCKYWEVLQVNDENFMSALSQTTFIMTLDMLAGKCSPNFTFSAGMSVEGELSAPCTLPKTPNTLGNTWLTDVTTRCLKLSTGRLGTE